MSACAVAARPPVTPTVLLPGRDQLGSPAQVIDGRGDMATAPLGTSLATAGKVLASAYRKATQQKLEDGGQPQARRR